MNNKNNKMKAIFHEVEDIGDIHIKLDEILKKKDISTYALSTKANIRFQTIQLLRENRTTRIDLNVLTKLCYVLNCKVEDLIEYVSPKSGEK